MAAQASTFLFPFIFEYNICAVAIAYTLMRSAMHRKYIRAPVWRDSKAPDVKDHGAGLDFQKAHTGLFGGLLFVALTIVSMVLFHQHHEKKEELTAKIIHFSSTFVLIGCSMLAVVWAYWKMRNHHLYQKPRDLDDFLLVLGLVGSLVFNIFAGYASIITVATAAFNITHVLALIKTFASPVQVIFQALLIIKARRQYTGNNKLLHSRPGRTQVTFLILVNLSFWLFKSSQMNEAEVEGFAMNFYGFLAWTLITRLCFPILLFYRFHSSACFAEIWHSAFTKHED